MTDLDERMRHASVAVRDRVSALPLPDLADRARRGSWKRPTALAVLAAAVVVLIVAGLAVFVGRGPRRTTTPGATRTPRIVAVDVHNLRPGSVLTSRATISVGELHHAPVFVARETDGRVVAFLGRSTHLGCKVVLAEPETIKGVTLPPRGVFFDPCGGSRWSLDGACRGGPCPRNLDQFAVQMIGDVAHVDLSAIIRGKSHPESPSSSTTPRSG